MMINRILLAAVGAYINMPVLADSGGLFDIDATLPLMAIQFLLLAVILNAIYYKPLGDAIDERASYVQGQLKQAKEQKEKAIALAQQYEQELRAVRKQSQEIIAKAEAEAQKLVAEKVQQAQQEVIAQRMKAAEEIAKEKEEALSALNQQVEALSSKILEKILSV